MKVVLAYDLGEAFVDDLRSSFPDIDFHTAYTPEDQLQETPDAEVQFGLITREAFLQARNLKWFQFIGIGFDGIVSVRQGRATAEKAFLVVDGAAVEEPLGPDGG